MSQYIAKLKNLPLFGSATGNKIGLKQTVAIARLNRIDSQATANIQRVLKKAAKHKNAAVALVISSNDNSYAQAYNIIRQIEIFQKNTSIPVYTFGEESVFSGGYLVLCAGKKSFVDNSSLVGNLGVNYKHTNIEQLVTKTLGFTINDFHTTDQTFTHRADSISKPQSDDKEFFTQFNIHLQGQVKEVFENLRKSKVKMSPEQYKDDLLQGEIYTGKKAVEQGLVDEIGTYHQILKKEFPQCDILDISRPSSKDIFFNVFELFWLNVRTLPFNILARSLQQKNN